MNSKLVRFAGSQVARQALQKQSVPGGPLDLKFGLHLLFKDKNTPILYKLLALGFGAALTSVLIVLETPLEAILAAILPLAGIALDLFIDGAEMILCTIVFAALILPHLTPKYIVATVRSVYNP